MTRLATRFGRNRAELRSANPLTDDQLRAFAPTIFAEEKHSSRSDRYAHIPTIDVLNGLRREGFQPFFVAQTRCRLAEKQSHTKHMLRLRHANQVNAAQSNEILVVNSHDGSSAYQLMAGCFRFVCANGLVSGVTHSDQRIRHSGNVVNDVIEGAIRVLNDFELIDQQREGMQSVVLNNEEKNIFANAALALKFDTELTPAPITESQILAPRRAADTKSDIWSVFNVSQENLIRGGLHARTATGGRTTTRPVQGIDQSLKLNRALWILAEGMKKLKS